MRTFENPANGHRVDVDSMNGLWTFLFGAIYLAIEGLWGHVAFIVILSFMFWFGFGPAGTILVGIMWLIYPFLTPAILSNSYLQRGWKEVDSDSPVNPPTPVAALAQKVPSSVADELAKLVALRDSGALSAAEYEGLKSRLLNI